MGFDASIDLTVDMLPVPGLLSDMDTREAVRAAVEALPGAKRISVEVCRGVSDSRRWLSVYEPGNARPRDDGDWAAAVAQVAEAVQGALA